MRSAPEGVLVYPVAHLFHQGDELPFGHRGGDGSVDIRAYHSAYRRLAVFLRHPLTVVFTSPLGILYDRNACLPAQSVGDLSHASVIRGRVVELLSVDVGYGINNDVCGTRFPGPVLYNVQKAFLLPAWNENEDGRLGKTV